MTGEFRRLCQQVIIRPMILGLFGLRVSNPERLPRSGPGIIVANHNSHFDTPALFALFPPRLAPSLRVVAASDYFFSNPIRSWIARRVFGAIALNRRCRPSDRDPLEACAAALASGAILLVFPEGTRGEPGRLGELKSGVAHLACRHPDVPVVPIGLVGFDRVLPKGARIPLPFICEARVGRPLRWRGDYRGFTAELKTALVALLGSTDDASADIGRAGEPPAPISADRMIMGGRS